jgi:hypothetical protein
MLSELSGQQKNRNDHKRSGARSSGVTNLLWPLGRQRIELAIAACKHVCHSHVTRV